MPNLKDIPPEKLEAYKKKLRKYYLTCFLMEGSKIVLFFIIFTLSGFMKDYIAALFFLMLLRTNGGGVHCKHYISCFIVSLLVLAASVVCAYNIQIPTVYSVVLLFISIILGYKLVPIVSDNRPEPSEKVIKRSKKYTAIIISFITILICICPSNHYLNIGLWTVIIHIIQLVIAKHIKGGETHVAFIRTRMEHRI